MNKLFSILLTVVIAVVASYATVKFVNRGVSSATQATAKESAYDRIMRTKTIRCAYQVWPPFLAKDPNTGKMSGVYYDLLERMGRDLSLKIDWAEEVGFVDMFEGFKTGRTDMFCAAVTIAPERTSVSDFSIPIAYGMFYLYVRDGNMRFDNAYNKANDPSVNLITLDGYIGATITKEDFPKAKSVSLPNLMGDTDILMSIAAGKADGAICDPSVAEPFIKNNPGKVRRVIGPPIHMTSFNLALPVGEDRLRAKINTTLTYYLDTGVMGKILKANNLDPSLVVPPAPPYASVPVK